jgi:hypothetical protein
MKAILSALLMATCIPGFAQPPGPEAPPSSPAVDKSVDDTLNRIRREQIKALEAYVAAHPKAKDGGEALKDIVADYGELAKHYQRLAGPDQKSDDKARLQDSLERQYYFMTKGGNPNLEDVCGNIVERFFLDWKGSRATPEDQRIAQAVFDQGKRISQRSKMIRGFAVRSPSSSGLTWEMSWPLLSPHLMGAKWISLP